MKKPTDSMLERADKNTAKLLIGWGWEPHETSDPNDADFRYFRDNLIRFAKREVARALRKAAATCDCPCYCGTENGPHSGECHKARILAIGKENRRGR